jgi:hypothetical protein
MRCAELASNSISMEIPFGVSIDMQQRSPQRAALAGNGMVNVEEINRCLLATFARLSRTRAPSPRTWDVWHFWEPIYHDNC